MLRDQVRGLADGGAAILLVEQKAVAALEISDWAPGLLAGRTAVDGAGLELARRGDIREVFLGREAG